MIWRLTADFNGMSRDNQPLVDEMSIDYDKVDVAYTAADFYAGHHQRFADGVEFNGVYTNVKVFEIQESTQTYAEKMDNALKVHGASKVGETLAEVFNHEDHGREEHYAKLDRMLHEEGYRHDEG